MRVFHTQGVPMFRRAFVASLALLVMAAGVGQARDKQSGLGRLAWFAGTWAGDKAGGKCEEHWTKAGPDGMIGLFRWTGPDGKVHVYEMLSLAEENGEVVMRIRHFDAKLTPWPMEKDGPTTMKLVESNATAAKFERKSEKGTL